MNLNTVIHRTRLEVSRLLTTLRGSPFAFLDLPLEVRLLIYEYLAAIADDSTGSPTPGKKQNYRHTHAILATSRVVHAEAAPVLYRLTPYPIHFAHKTVAARGIAPWNYRAPKSAPERLPTYFAQVQHLRLRLTIRRADVGESWADRRKWLRYRGDAYNDDEPYDEGYYTAEEEWVQSKRRVCDRVLKRLRTVCEALVRRSIRLATLEVVVVDEQPDVEVNLHRLLLPLGTLSDVGSVEFRVPGVVDWSSLQTAMTRPRPGLLRLSPELRRRILSQVFADPGYESEIRETPPRFRTKLTARHAVLRLNRRLHDEARAVLYGEGLFGFKIPEWTCSLLNGEMRWSDPEYSLGDRFEMITRIWIRVSVLRDRLPSPKEPDNMKAFLEGSKRLRRHASGEMENFCRYLRRRPPLNLLRVYVEDPPLFRGPRRPNFGIVEPLLTLSGIAVVWIDGDIDKKTALLVSRLLEGNPSEDRVLWVRDDLIDRQRVLFAKWVVALHTQCVGAGTVGARTVIPDDAEHYDDYFSDFFRVN